ncbi:MAG TPA: hypothetical protein VHI31_08605, partial [Actinomycetota bacterium]|nr:hypothetical protein [Actinomycetota bacterium]
SVMSDAYKLAASGAPSSALPAYTFQPPLDVWLAGLLPQMENWDWQDPPGMEPEMDPAFPTKAGVA